MTPVNCISVLLKPMSQKQKFLILRLIILLTLFVFSPNFYPVRSQINTRLLPILKNFSSIANFQHHTPNATENFTSSLEEASEEHEFRQKCYTLFNAKKTQNFDNETWASYTGVTTHHYEYNLINGTFPTCENYLSERLVEITQTPVNSWEESFPIAYGILVYHNFAQIEELFRIIYRPQNFYCFHVDVSAEESFKEIVSRLLNCLKVFVNSHRNKVTAAQGQILTTTGKAFKRPISQRIRESRLIIAWKLHRNL